MFHILTISLDQQVYGAGTSSLFAVQVAEDESSFSVVDNTRTSTKTRGFGLVVALYSVAEDEEAGIFAAGEEIIRTREWVVVADNKHTFTIKEEGQEAVVVTGGLAGKIMISPNGTAIHL